jgi:hypothetical protein
MTGWTNRVRAPGPREMQEVRDAAEDLERQARRVPGRTGPIFGTVTQILFLGTALISTVLASMHLYNKLSRPHTAPHDEHPPEHEHEKDHRSARRHTNDTVGRHGRG